MNVNVVLGVGMFSKEVPTGETVEKILTIYICIVKKIWAVLDSGKGSLTPPGTPSGYRSKVRKVTFSVI